MKYIWEEKDILPGRWVCKKNKDGTWSPTGWTAKWTQQIGWIGSGHKCHLISICDGMIGHHQTQAELVEYFNKEGIEPLSLTDLHRMVDYLDGNWER